VLNAGSGWRQILDRYQVNMILLPPDAPLLELLAFDRRWQVLYRDQQAELLARTTVRAYP